MSDLIVNTYDDQTSGQQAFSALPKLQKMQLLSLEDAALAFKDDKGKVKVKQTLENQHIKIVGISDDTHSYASEKTTYR